MANIQMEHLPRDVFFRIFSRLSIRCLARICCVSKFINGIISDPLFHIFHFEQSVPEVYPLIFTYRAWHENIISVNEMQLQGQKIQVRFTSIGHLITSGPHELVGTCNGLLCFTPCCLEEPILIFNPITREHISLGKPTVTQPQSCTTIFGFGFHPSTKEYKVVCILYPTMLLNGQDEVLLLNGQDESLDFHIMAEVHTLGSTGSWRKVRNFPHAPQDGQVYAAGAIYWKIHAQHRLQHDADHIMSFNLSTEEFSTIPHPSFEDGLNIVELRGSLTAVTFSWRQMTVWILKDQLGNEWDMEYCIPLTVPRDLDKKFPRLICMWESYGILITWLQDKLFSCVRMTGRIHDHWVSGFPSWLDWDMCCAYRPTLFPLKSYYDDQQMRDNLPRYISDAELYSKTSLHQVCASKPNGKRDGIVRCFGKNSLLHD